MMTLGGGRAIITLRAADRDHGSCCDCQKSWEVIAGSDLLSLHSCPFTLQVAERGPWQAVVITFQIGEARHVYSWGNLDEVNPDENVCHASSGDVCHVWGGVPTVTIHDYSSHGKNNTWTAFMEGLIQCSANYVPLSPICFLERAAVVYGDKDSIIYGTVRYTWRDTLQRCVNLASALSRLEIFPGDVVAALAPNIPALYELHFGVPMAGAILSALNPRLDSTMLALILQQLEAKIIFVDYQFLQVFLQALDILSEAKIKPPILVLILECCHPATFSSTIEKIPAVDMFRCNGWCFPWTVAALDAAVTDQRPLPHKVDIVIAGALPPPQVLMKVVELGFNVTHSYGMTEALGPVTARLWHPEPNSYQHAKIKCCQGLHNLIMEGVDVKDPSTMKSVPRDRKTIGERRVVSDWDLAVMHPDGYIQMKDRSKDVIISGVKTISTIEIEAVLVGHPMVMEVAVVGRPDDCLGETPCAFLKLKEGCATSADEITNFCAERLPTYMVPQTIIFGDLPVNSTGKIQKFVLREKAKAVGKLPP
ncbi:putative acyl-activating enzyme 21 [Vitis vinifera]|uniref:Putative acyl-activating enzyme 21 n=1 Tax=Vitis vinifera TaxID=29760 RepID=A0A438CGU7_VITVI|nr:putative acyl-activating enzyme 21 [Vitis vinifera]